MSVLKPARLDPASPERRLWLQRAATLGAAAGLGGLASFGLGVPRAVQAADYRALVCVFQYGGNDGMNTIVPTDGARHRRYTDVRAGLALPRSALLGLESVDFGLHPALSALLPWWQRGAVAPVFNVGPLYQPISKRDYRHAGEGSLLVPDSLFSHADQQHLWSSAGSQVAQSTGWGGRACDVMGMVNPVISVNGNTAFGAEDRRAPLVLPGPGSYFGANGLGADDMAWRPNQLRRAAVDALLADATATDVHRAFAEQQTVAFELADRLGPLVGVGPTDPEALPAINEAFAHLMSGASFHTSLAAQLYQVAQLMAQHVQVQGNRQVYFVGQGGYDTHEGQVAGDPTLGVHADLLRELGDALAAFHQALDNLGLGRKVVSFTQSDFGRTFAPNLSSGTDHAWGNHHLVVGRPVQGLSTYGQYPELRLGGPDDVGEEAWELQGRWIPTTSVDQYAATLLRWLGASERQLDLILPQLVNYGAARNLGFV